MDPALFLTDLERKPEVLHALADHLESHDPWGVLPMASRFVLVGMGSSSYAAGVAAARLRALGIHAVSELASSDLLPAADGHTVVIAISAGGGSRETRAAVEHYRDKASLVVVTNSPEGGLAQYVEGGVHELVELRAGVEEGGVASRSFQHTLALLLALEPRVARADLDVPALVRRSAAACEDLLRTRGEWLPELRARLVGPHGVHVVAPARRLSSAQQSALMLREGPRLPAYACETGDWSHVDVYLTSTTDYRMLLLAGSRWEDELLRWTTERGATVVAVGADVPDADLTIRYAGDEDDDVRLLTEVLVAELLAADLWLSP
ncbi:MAG TPA: SIS domain-containing protein [Candidatus Nanopelagicales bacterium]|nr:SIS domain-containing protein [Candidatus Nanopelagicales bacterium]